MAADAAVWNRRWLKGAMCLSGTVMLAGALNDVRRPPQRYGFAAPHRMMRRTWDPSSRPELSNLARTAAPWPAASTGRAQLLPLLPSTQRARPLGAATVSAEAQEGAVGSLRNEGFKIEVRQFSRFLESAAWFSWWTQVILNVVAGVILFFTNQFVQPGASRSLFTGGFVFAVSGLCLGAISTFWTWGFTGVAKRLRRNILEPSSSLAMIGRVVRTAITINVLGLMSALVGAEQFVGTLMAKILTQQGLAPFVVQSAAASLQYPSVSPLDVFVIQANTNTLLSHFASLLVSLVLLLRYSRLARTLERP